MSTTTTPETTAAVGRKWVDDLEARLRGAGAVRESGSTQQGFYHVPIERLPRLLRDLIDEYQARLATVTGIDVRDGTELLYHMCFDDDAFTATLKILVPRTTDAMESITPWLPGAEFIEREIHDLLGVNFPGHPRMKRLILSDDWPDGVYPLRRGFKKEHGRPRPEDKARSEAAVASRGLTPQQTIPASDGKRTMVAIGPFHPLQEEPE
ncbi:MAG: NADH-quinone oxidoreductase subunit C, partial [Phycisphaerae bacterium]|nr:NADH-quinone oxidoreductase subunit C [Phycisphaerae bacterium]